MTMISEEGVSLLAPPTGTRLGFADPIYDEVMDFLITEADLLDSGRFRDWLGLVQEDIEYLIAPRKILRRIDGDGIRPDEGTPTNYAFLEILVRRNGEIENAFDRDPLPRERRLVTNVVVHTTDVANEYRVDSALIYMRSQFDLPNIDMYPAARHDVLRRTDAGLRLSQRVIVPDLATLGAPLAMSTIY